MPRSKRYARVAANRATPHSAGSLRSWGNTVWMQPPFYCDYGSNIYLGKRVFFNFNCVVLDVCEVKIGDYTLFGSGAQILTSLHPFNAALRRGQESESQWRLVQTFGLVAAYSFLPVFMSVRELLLVPVAL